MYFPHISLVALALAPACMAVEHQAHMHKRAAAKYTTVTYSFVSMVTTTSEMVISSNIQETGPATIIPGTLTMTFNVLPAYLYLETAKVSTFRSTITRTTTSKLAAGKTVTSSTAANTATAAAEVPKGSVTTSAASPKTTSAAGSATTTATSPKTTSSIPAAYLSDNSNCGYEGHYCGSGRDCRNGVCYYLTTDSNNCGTVGNVCPNQPTYQCHGGVCVNVQTDVHNCGMTGLYCGEGYGCSGGKCINLQTDNSNCGTIGTVCKTGTGCSKGTCIDTTSDPLNCSDAGYACPKDTPNCVNSLCVA